MLRRDILDLLQREPFEPFQIRLVNGDNHNIFYPQNVAVLETEIQIAPPDQNWVIFPIDKIASIESLIADYQAESTAHS